MAVGDYVTWSGTSASTNYWGSSNTTEGYFTSIVPKSAPFSVQWRARENPMASSRERLHVGNGWVEFETRETLAAAALVMQNFKAVYPTVDWKIEERV